MTGFGYKLPPPVPFLILKDRLAKCTVATICHFVPDVLSVSICGDALLHGARRINGPEVGVELVRGWTATRVKR